MYSNLIISFFLSIIIYLIIENNLELFIRKEKYFNFLNSNLLISSLIFFVCYFILDLIDIRNIYEKFNEKIDISNYRKFNNENKFKKKFNIYSKK
jgi:hypothetical protein